MTLLCDSLEAMRLRRSKAMSVHVSTCTSYGSQRIDAGHMKILALIGRVCVFPSQHTVETIPATS
jgi:hypothetical protein